MLTELLGKLTTPSFRFIVALSNVPIGAFTDCTMPSLEWEMEEVKEGGLNTKVHQLPGQRRSAKIVLKNGIGIAKDLFAWYEMSSNEMFWRRNVTITLLSSLLIPMVIVHVEDALPIKWSGPELQAGSNTIAIQTLELACGEVSLLLA